MTKRIHLISGPRNISTAMMYSFAHRTSCSVLDEPFYAAYLQETGIEHPGREEILASQSTDRSTVLDLVLKQSFPTDELFIKNMAHHILKNEWPLYLEQTNFFLIRNPLRIIASYAQVIEDFTIDDLGLKQQFEMAQYFHENGGEVVVADTGELLKDPPNYMRSLCEALVISFDENMLSWKPGKRPEDGIWAKYWYDNVHRSTGLEKKVEKPVSIESKYEELYQEALSYYNQLKTFEIKH